MRETINKGSTEAMYRLGSAYWHGSYDLLQDKRKGFDWIKKAAGRRHKAAMYDLYRFYTLGIGTEKSSRDAHIWLKGSVENGNRKATLALAQNYQYGLGVTKNSLTALAWFRVADAAGEKKASKVLLQPEQQALIRKTLFRDCPNCPEMVIVPKSSFLMGLHKADGIYKYMNKGISYRPRHIVNFVDNFAVGRFEISNRNWDACVKEQGCKEVTRSETSASDKQPRVSVSWDDATQYVAWLKKKKGKPYRLLTESEWEYVARAGMMTDYYWGDRLIQAAANCNNCSSEWDGVSAAPVGSFPANGFFVSDVHGNAAEWVQDCLHTSYEDKPPRGKA